jgi:hypothetical protein
VKPEREITPFAANARTEVAKVAKPEPVKLTKVSAPVVRVERTATKNESVEPVNLNKKVLRNYLTKSEAKPTPNE